MRNIYKDFITLVDPGSRNRLTTVSNDMSVSAFFAYAMKFLN